MTKIQILNQNNILFPENLKSIKKSPQKLYLEGNPNLLQSNCIAVIGSRNCSENGKNLAKLFAYELVKQDITIVSGLARGIDTVAHQSAIELNGKTIAVLGNGFNHIFPEENLGLYSEIIQKNNLVISEYPPDTEKKSSYFLERNRIITGLSLGVLVIEAGFKSGTSVTFKIAKEQGKKVFALPHEITDKHGIGTNEMIRKGAILVTSVKDIINEISILSYKKNITSENKIKSPTPPPITKKTFNNSVLEETYNLVTLCEGSLDEIYRKSGKSINELNKILLMLELEGHIKKVTGGYKCI